MAEGCDERFDLKFYKWIWDYKTRTKPRVEALLKQFQNTKKIIRLASTEQVENFFVNRVSDEVKSFLKISTSFYKNYVFSHRHKNFITWGSTKTPETIRCSRCGTLAAVYRNNRNEFHHSVFSRADDSD